MENSAFMAYPACGLLILVYAWGRFNTPPSNRSSTRQALYWWSGAGYVLSALALFAGLCALLQAGNWRTAILGPADQPSLPAPIDRHPGDDDAAPFNSGSEAAGRMAPRDISRLGRDPGGGQAPRSGNDAAHLRGDRERRRRSCAKPMAKRARVMLWARHLRGQRGEGLELSQYRFTRVVKLHDRIRTLSGEPRYSRFFAEAEDEYAELDRRTGEFLRRSAASLTLAERQYAIDEAAAFDELVVERRDEFAQQCREIFGALALFLARAVLRSERSERDIVGALREIGFSAAEPMNLPHFPIDSLTALAMALFLYLILGGWVFAHVAGVARQPVDGLMMAGKITLVRLVTIGVTVWLMQRYAFFHRVAGEPPRFFAYLVNGFIAAAVAFALSLPVRCDTRRQRGADEPPQLCDMRRGGVVLRRLGRRLGTARLAALRRGGGVRLCDGCQS